MALNFRPYDDAAGRETRARWSSSLDGIMEQYLAAKQNAQAQGRLTQQDAIAAEGRVNAEKDRQGANLLQYGFDPRQVTPDVLARSQPGMAPQGPAQPGMQTPAQAENPLFGAVRSFLEKKKSAAARASQEQTLGMDKTRSEIRENDAQAWAARNPKPAFTPQQMLDQENEMRELQVPGYSLGKDVRPTRKEAQDLRTASAETQNFLEGVSRLKELIKKHGGTQIVGAGSGEMGALSSNLKLKLKEIDKLGVLSSSDISFLDAQISDPTSFKSLGSTNASILAQLDSTEGRAKSSLAKALGARGYSPVGPAVGEIRKGYRFKGGDPAKPESWEKS